MIAAPAYHSVTLENESVRVLDTTVPPGHTVPLHTHRWPAVHYILTWSDVVRRDHTGTILLDTATIRSPHPKAPPPGPDR
jgi:hypothetical protein